MRVDYFWSAEDRERLIAMLSAGDSYSIIGKALSRTRSAVGAYILREKGVQIAAADRVRHVKKLGPRGPLKQPRLPPSKPVSMLETTLQPQPELEPPMSSQAAPQIDFDQQPEPQPAPAPEPVKKRRGGPVPIGLFLYQLDASQCRWPGDYDPEAIGGYRFCAHPVDHIGAPYCRWHTSMANPASRSDEKAPA
jgi:hypothetical protein